MPHFMIYQFIKPCLDNKMSVFEEYGAFNHVDTSKYTRIPRKASSHLLGQKSQEPQSERGY